MICYDRLLFVRPQIDVFYDQSLSLFHNQLFAANMKRSFGLKSFFNYLLLEEKIELNPMELIDAPKLVRKLPRQPIVLWYSFPFK